MDSPAPTGNPDSSSVTRAPQNRVIGFTHLRPSGWVTTSAYSALTRRSGIRRLDIVSHAERSVRQLGEGRPRGYVYCAGTCELRLYVPGTVRIRPLLACGGCTGRIVRPFHARGTGMSARMRCRNADPFTGLAGPGLTVMLAIATTLAAR